MRASVIRLTEKAKAKVHHGDTEARRKTFGIEKQKPKSKPKDGEKPESTDRKNAQKFFCKKLTVSNADERRG
jgi:hypothetical protein